MRSWAVLGHEAATCAQSHNPERTTLPVHCSGCNAYERDADEEARRMEKGGNSYHTTSPYDDTCIRTKVEVVCGGGGVRKMEIKRR